MAKWLSPADLNAADIQVLEALHKLAVASARDGLIAAIAEKTGVADVDTVTLTGISAYDVAIELNWCQRGASRNTADVKRNVDGLKRAERHLRRLERAHQLTSVTKYMIDSAGVHNLETRRNVEL